MASPTTSPIPSALATASNVISGKKAVGPFAPNLSILGGVPTPGLDGPLTFVFLILFLGGAAIHFSVHEFNGKRGHKFHLSDAIFDFCMVRTVTCVMRIVWSFKPDKNSIVLAALIFENAGVVVLFAVNVVFTQRMIRALNPKIGWHPIFGRFIMAILISVPMIIVWNIVNLVVSFYTLNKHVLEVTRDLLLFGSCWSLFLSLFPILFIGFLALSNPLGGKIENFGLGSSNAKLIILLSATSMLVVGAIVRLVSNVQVHSKDVPGAIDSKVVFYTTGFFLEIVVVYLYATSRIDLRFWVPDGSSKPGDYSKAKSGFTLPLEDEEALFEEADFKTRFSSGTDLQREIRSAWENNDEGNLPSTRLLQNVPKRWQDTAVDRSKATREQVRQAIWDLKLRTEMVGQPMSVGNEEELLVYAFRCRKNSFSDGDDKRVSFRMPRKIAPPRSESWAMKDRRTTPEIMRDMI